jgi:hypothetical protein
VSGILLQAVVAGSNPSGGGGDVTAPVLSSPVDTVNGPTAATGGFTTDETGTAYWVVLLTADSTPSAAQIGSGLKADGVTAAVKSGSQVVSSTGAKTLSPAPTMLTPGTGYKIAFAQQDAANNWSNVIVGDGFTTAAVVKAFFTAGVTSITNPIAATGSTAVVAGDAVAFMYSEQSSTVTAGTLTDNLGNTYTACNAGTANGTTAGLGYYGIITVAGTLTSLSLTATASTNDASVSGAIFNGPFTGIDANPVVKTDSSSPMTGTSTGVLSQASELVVGMMASSANGALSATSPWVEAGTPASTGLRRALIAYQNVEATTAVTPSFTAAAAETTVVQTLSFARSA